ncbi:MAG: hypothetical protein EAZ24_11805 [Burkholderiales bacterium]|nr:MAG: hypothetical protein EAZ24_11805 [Burkholderiales bacterium]TAG79297.1 MAG: hypothetical protein EAZ21_10855 [Betaproteobacteria bacterium]
MQTSLIAPLRNVGAASSRHLRIAGQALALATLIGAQAFSGTGIALNAQNDIEALVVKALREVRAAQLEQASKTVSQILERAPNYRLAHLIQGDLLLARSRPLQAFGNATPEPSESLQGLRAEALARLQRAQEAIPADRVPANFWRVPVTAAHAMALDVDRSRLYVFENRGGQLHRIADFYATIGKEGSGKAKEGDQRTPIGAYFLQAAIPRQKLTDFYGAGAYPLDYPNDFDRRLNRSGYGIWLHGVGSDTFARAPRASDGCIVVSNPDLKLIERFIVPGRTPIVVAQSIEWIDRNQAQRQSQGVLTAFERWRGDMQSLNVAKYLEHYGPAFSADGIDFRGWEAQRRQLFSRTEWAQVEVSNVSAMQYPGTRDIALVTFDQAYKSSRFNSQLKKRQLWQLAADGRWKIIFEGHTQS